MKNKKILYVLTRSDIVGGAGVHMRELIRHALVLGAKVKVAIGGNGVFYKELLAEEIDVQILENLVRPIRPISDFLAVRELNKLISDFSPDIMHLHSAKAGLVGRISGRYKKVRTIYTVHGWPFTNGISGGNKFLFKTIEKLMMFFSDTLITVSDYDKKLAIDAGFPCISKIFTIHNGMPNPFYLDRIGQSKEIELRLIMVARFDKQKNQRLLVESLAKLPSVGWSLNFVGDGPEIDDCIKLVKSISLEDKVKFLGYSNAVNEQLEMADVFLLITNWEGLPLTIIEAMGLQMPIVASNVGGVSELVSHGENGFLVDGIDSIIAAVSTYLNNRELVCKHGRESKSLFNSHFDVRIMLKKTFELYERVLSK